MGNQSRKPITQPPQPAPPTTPIQPTPPSQPSRHLTINDLALIHNTLNSVAVKCYNIGLQLGVQSPQLDIIVKDHTKCEDQLREIIKRRLKQEPPLTWSDLVTALRAVTVGENRLASEIDSTFLQSSTLLETDYPVRPSPLPQSSVPRLSHSDIPTLSSAEVPAHDTMSPGQRSVSRHPQPDQSLYQPQSMHHSTESPRPSSHHHLHQYHTATQLPSTQYPTHHTSTHPPLDHSHHQPLHYPAHQSQHVQSHPPSSHIPYHPTQYTHYTPQQQRSAARPHPVRRSRPGPNPVRSEPVHMQNSRAFVTYIDYVKTFYRESEVERDTTVVKWPPTPSKVYINLACIDRHSVSGRGREYDEVTEAMVRDGNIDAIKNVRKGPIDFSEIAKNIPNCKQKAANKRSKKSHKKRKNISIPNSKQKGASDKDQRRLILVEGAPGVGKSTFAWEFCRRWERGEIAQQYQLVLLLRLREERISNAQSLEDLIYHPSKDVHQAVCHELLCSHDFHTLIILEGFDELPDACRKSWSIFMDLIAGKLLPLATVLVTSRPWATQEIRLDHGDRIYQHIEILGFTGQQITDYIESTLPQHKVSDLKAYLESHPQIRAGMYIPLNSAIVVTVFEESQASGYAMPTTLTALYTSLTQTLLLRYLRGNPEYETDSKFLETLKDLPPPVDCKFHKLCRLAYDGTVGTSDQVQLIFRDLPSDFDDLGFMDSVTELYVTRGAVSSHNFLHLTFQEFFAAVHISSMSGEQQVEHFKRHKEGRLKVVLRFLAGLNKLNCFSKVEIANNFFRTPSTHEGSIYQMSCDAAVRIDLVQWLFEAQSDDVIEHVLGQKTIEFDLLWGMLPLDYYSLGYCISHSQCQWVLRLGKKIGVDKVGQWAQVEALEVKMLVAGAGTRREASGRVVGLNGGRNGIYNELCPNNIIMLFTEWKSILFLRQLSLELPVECGQITWPDLSALRELKLRIRGWTEWKLNNLLSHLSLESLTIAVCSDSGLDWEDCVAIGDHVKSTTSLKELCILEDEEYLLQGEDWMIVFDDTEAITAALASNQSLPLERLELKCECTFTSTDVDSLAQFITNTTTLQYLSIWRCTFSAGVDAITAALASNQSLPLERLELECNCKFTSTAVDSLAQFITNTTTLQYLSIRRCTFSAGVDAITAALASNQSLPLELECYCTFTSTDVDSLTQLITNTTTLQYVSSNEDLLIRECTLNTYGLNLRISGTIKQQLNTLLPHLPLKSLTIAPASNNAVLVHEDCIGIGKHVTATTSLRKLCISSNLSEEGMEAITAALASNQSLPLERLELVCECTFTATAAVDSLAQFIANTTTLQYLSIRRCTFSAHALLVLARAIHHNSILKTKNLEEFHLPVNGDNEVKDLAQLLVEYPDMMNSSVAVNSMPVYSTHTRMLYLSNSSISDNGAVALAQALHHNSTLTELYLSNNSISDAGAVALAQALHHNSTLTLLHLSYNSISDAGAVALAQALHHNSTLTELYLSNNSISDAAAVALSQALHHNSTLTELYLSNNRISGVGVVALAQTLHHNSTLTQLDLSNNSISDAGAVALAQALHHNSTLQGLGLSGNDGIGEEGTHQLVQALTVNTSISELYGYNKEKPGCLWLPMRCKVYAIQCLQYHSVKKRLYFFVT